MNEELISLREDYARCTNKIANTISFSEKIITIWLTAFTAVFLYAAKERLASLFLLFPIILVVILGYAIHLLEFVSLNSGQAAALEWRINTLLKNMGGNPVYLWESWLSPKYDQPRITPRTFYLIAVLLSTALIVGSYYKSRGLLVSAWKFVSQHLDRSLFTSLEAVVNLCYLTSVAIVICGLIVLSVAILKIMKSGADDMFSADILPNGNYLFRQSFHGSWKIWNLDPKEYHPNKIMPITPQPSPKLIPRSRYTQCCKCCRYTARQKSRQKKK